MTQRTLIALVVVLAVVVAVPAVWVFALQGSGSLELDEAEIRIEINDTDGDAGIHVFLDGEGWRAMTITDPNGEEILDLTSRGSIGAQGVTEFFFESAEPSFEEQPLSELLARFPEGEYEYVGETVDGDEITGTATLSHDIPAAPVTSPDEDATLDGGDVVISWDPVTEPAGIEIVGYQLVVEQEEPLRVLSVDLPSTTTSYRVSPDFFAGGTEEFKYEVLSIEASGNQTITESAFETE